MPASVTAAPAATNGTTTFSFAQWVEDIIANPDTTLTVDEAIAAAEEAGIVGSASGLQKRLVGNPTATYPRYHKQKRLQFEQVGAASGQCID